jgi:peroxiredoxin
MFPHERSLVKKYANDPFVLLGVNEDPDAKDARKAENDGQVTWRSWWDPGSNGKIASAYGVSGMPAVFLIDHHGKLRHRWNGPPDEKDLEKRIDELIQEAGKDQGKK